MTPHSDHKELLRAGLDALANETLSVDLRDGARRVARRLRWVRAAAGSVTVAAVLTSGAVFALRMLPEHSPAANVGSGQPTVDKPLPTATASGDAPHQTDPLNPQVGPPQPAIGVSYPYDLFVHCGLRYAAFGGRTWLTITPQELSGSENYRAGTMTLVDDSTARFQANGQVWVFHPTDDQIPPCD